jgi:SAM-dependent methyltransferase
MHNLERHGIPWHGAGRLLDVGCGGGSFLHRMHLQGWQVTGIDVHQPVIQRINTQLGLSALAGSLPHPSLKSDSFDVVTFWQSLEHMHWPLQMLREAHRLLAPGGKLVVGVPNIASGPFRWFGPDWFPLELPRHLVHFSPATLRQMLEAAGFLDPETQFVRAPTWLQSSARIARDRHHGSLLLHSLALRPLSRVVADYLKFTGQSEYITAIASKPAHAAVAQQPRRAMTG